MGDEKLASACQQATAGGRVLSDLLRGGDSAWIPFAGFWGLLVLIAVAEAWRPLHDGGEEPRGRIAGNVGFGIINATLGAVLPVSTVLPAQWALRHGIGAMNRIALPALLVVAATVLVRSLATYAVHRLSHAVPLLWRVHRVHHSDTRLDLSTGFRNHPLELAFVAPWLAAVTVAAGLDPATLLVYEAVAVGFALWTHANLSLPAWLDGPLRFLVVTPAMHHVHHSSRRAQTDSNFGDILSLWDRLFGTYRLLPPGDLKAVRFGLGDGFDSGAPNFLHQLGGPFRREPRPPGRSETGEEGGHVRAERVDRIAALHQDRGGKAELGDAAG